MRSLLAAALCLAACRASPPAPPTEAPAAVDASAPTDAASAQASAAPQADAPIELDIPLLSGDSEPLAGLRGKVVVLLVSSSDRPGWAEFRRHFEARLQEVGHDRLTVVAVANDADPTRLLAEWDRDPPPFLLGWDPDGAVALRLGLASLPAMLVLDPQGRLRGSVGGVDEANLAKVSAQVAAWTE